MYLVVGGECTLNYMLMIAEIYLFITAEFYRLMLAEFLFLHHR